ncbi:glycoside hydrolase family 66 protein [Paenibacillus marinisediminis]
MLFHRKKYGRSMIILLGCLMLMSAGCSKQTSIKAEEVKVQNMVKSITTDKAAYAPGNPVKFTLQMNQPISGAKLNVQYRHLDELIGQQELHLEGNEAIWDWTPPEADFKGYMVEVFLSEKGEVKDQYNIAVDVSSDWSKFPRYGYLADFYEMRTEDMAKVINRLNRFHINGIQFYDWQYKHHAPIKIENGELAKQWKDIANRPVASSTVKGYIDLAHEHNIKAMNYNLIFGAYEDAEQDGVKSEWGLYKDPNATEQDKHPLPDSWPSDIMVYDPANPEWQDYLIEQETRVFEKLPFDGWHVDQLGDRGSLWTAKGDIASLPSGYVSFLQAAKQKLDVDYVMNAVDQYALTDLAANAPLNFLYTEVWGGHPRYNNLKDIIDKNKVFSQDRLNTVLAAYMNYGKGSSKGEFNTPGVLLTDAVIFASGGAHLELGENMLCSEYFPNRNLSIPKELEQQLVRYYDFMVAYQNLLRDGLENTKVTAQGAGDVPISPYASQGKVWSFAKHKDGMDIVHFINFTDAVTMNWNDNEGTQVEPTERSNVKVAIQTSKKVDRIMFASPDYYNGSPVELKFEQKDDQVSLELPKLKYWDMVKIAYKSE